MKIAKTISTSKLLGVSYILCVAIGCGLIIYARGHYETRAITGYNNQLIINLLQYTGGALMAVGWMAALFMTRIQNYHFIFSIVTQIVGVKEAHMDEREIIIRRKVYEYSYTVVSIIVIILGVFIAITSRGRIIQPAVYGLYITRSFVWILLNLFILFIFLPSLIALRFEDK